MHKNKDKKKINSTQLLKKIYKNNQNYKKKYYNTKYKKNIFKNNCKNISIISQIKINKYNNSIL
jgi:hypothetical protein